MTINLNTINGNTDLFLKKCSENDECLLSEDELKNPNDSPDIIQYSYQSGDDTIKFTHSKKFTCKTLDRSFCYYLIVVFHNPENNDLD